MPDKPVYVTSGEPAHPGCDQCGRQPGPWFAPSDQWNLVMGGPDAAHDPGGMLCATCYLDRAYQVFPRSSFVVSIEERPTNG